MADDPDDPSRALIRQILGAIAQYERSMVRLRLRSGRARKRETGYAGDGPPPFGFRAECRKLVEDPKQQAVLVRIRELRADGCSLRQIADVLTEEGFKPKRSATWYPGSLRLIVNRMESPQGR